MYHRHQKNVSFKKLNVPPRVRPDSPAVGSGFSAKRSQTPYTARLTVEANALPEPSKSDKKTNDAMQARLGIQDATNKKRQTVNRVSTMDFATSVANNYANLGLPPAGKPFSSNVLTIPLNQRPKAELTQQGELTITYPSAKPGSLPYNYTGAKPTTLTSDQVKEMKESVKFTCSAEHKPIADALLCLRNFTVSADKKEAFIDLLKKNGITVHKEDDTFRAITNNRNVQEHPGTQPELHVISLLKNQNAEAVITALVLIRK